ncbi:MAG: YbhB/YbcL family Raf kinase inhibitor-like protein, partial [Acidobacteriota bacterium]
MSSRSVTTLALATAVGVLATFPDPARGEEGAMQITSPEFDHGQPMPPASSCDGEDRSPTLAWVDPPEGTRSFVLIMDDPDAPVGTWDHWLLYDLPAASRGLPAGVPAREHLPEGGTHGENSWGRNDYGGPCPPSGTHR